MSNMRVVENSPAKLVLEKSSTAAEIWRERGRSFVNPLVVLAGSYAGYYIMMSTNKLSAPTWLYWAVGIGVLVAETFALYSVLNAERKITITIDLHSRVASRTIIFFSGKKQKNEIALEKVSRIVLHHYSEIRAPRLLLDASDQSNFTIATDSDLWSALPRDDVTNDAPIIKSLESLGKKIGQILQKPVVKKVTEVDINETLISEDVIQS